MGVQMTNIIIQDRKKVKKTKDFHKYQLYGIEGYTLIFIKGCMISRFCTQLA